MLSSTLQKVYVVAIGQHPLVKALMAMVFNSNPPRPRYEDTWDIDEVLAHLRTLRNNGLSLAQLARKLVCVLVLSTLMRVSELASISLDTIVKSELFIAEAQEVAAQWLPSKIHLAEVCKPRNRPGVVYGGVFGKNVPAPWR